MCVRGEPFINSRRSGDGRLRHQRGQRTAFLRSEYIVPFVLVADYAIANQHASKTTGAADEDLDALFSALWKGTANLITRSKVGHMPRFLLEVRYVKGFDGIIGAMDEKVRLLGADGHSLSADEQLALRSCDGALLDITALSSALARVSQDVERVPRSASLSYRR